MSNRHTKSLASKTQLAICLIFLLTFTTNAISSPNNGSPDNDQKLTTSRREVGYLGAQSVSLEMGGAYAYFGGAAYPKIALRGDPNTRYYAHGKGASFRLWWDFSAIDLDWRVGVHGAFPRLAGLQVTSGIRKNMSAWPNPRIIASAMAGIEFAMAGGQPDATYILPLALVKGELAILHDIDSQWSVGGGIDLGLRYGFPLGPGFDTGIHLRVSYNF